METILFVSATEPDGSLGKQGREALAAAVDLSAKLPGSSLAVGLFGEKVQAAADSVASCGARAFYGVEGADFSQPRYASDAAAVEALARAAKATIVVATGVSRLARVLPGAAMRLGGRVDTHVTSLATDGTNVNASRWYYRQRMEAVLSRAARPWVVSLDPGSQAPWQGPAGQAKFEVVPVSLVDGDKRTKVTGIQAPASDQQTIRPDAKLLFVAGAGWTKKQADGQSHTPEAARLILDFITKTQASLGSSKSLVDQSGEGQAVLPFLTHMNQVGQTGSTPRHPKGLAACCHGEEPHVVGWRFINERRAVNLDANCGWAKGKADVVYVADAFKVMAKINELLG